MNMIYTDDEANKIIKDDIQSLNEEQLHNLVEYLIKKGIEIKVNKYGTSVYWKEATDNIMMLFKNLIMQIKI